MTKVSPISESVAQNLHVALYSFQVDDYVDLKVSEYKRVAVVAKGKLVFSTEDKDTEFVAPHLVVIPEKTQLRVIGKSNDAVMYTTFAIRGIPTKDDIISPEDVPQGAFLRTLLSEARNN